jgi:alpha-galactosidase
VKQWIRWNMCAILAAGAIAFGSPAYANQPGQQAPLDGMRGSVSIQGKTLSVSVNPDGSYSIAQADIPGTVMRSDVEADVDSQLLRSSAYPQHKTAQSEFHDEFGSGSVLTVTHSGLAGKPDLLCTLRLYRDQSWGDIEVKVLNNTGRAITVQAIRSVHATDAPVISLNGPASADRILSDSYPADPTLADSQKEDRPQLAIRDFCAAPEGMHRAVGSQLI